MHHFKSEQFRDLYDRGIGVLLEDMVLEDCRFDGCGISMTTEIGKRGTVRNVRLKKCKAIHCHIGPAIFDEVVVDGLATYDLLILWGPLFRHVTLKGAVGSIKVNSCVHFSDRREKTELPFDLARDEFYREVDWALDICEAKFYGFELRGVPARLVRRDPETQVVVTRKKALSSGWRAKLSPSNSYWPFVIDLFLGDGDADIVLVAPKRKPKKKYLELLDGLNELRDLGVAELD